MTAGQADVPLPVTPLSKPITMTSIQSSAFCLTANLRFNELHLIRKWGGTGLTAAGKLVFVGQERKNSDMIMLLSREKIFETEYTHDEIIAWLISRVSYFS